MLRQRNKRNCDSGKIHISFDNINFNTEDNCEYSCEIDGDEMLTKLRKVRWRILKNDIENRIRLSKTSPHFYTHEQ